MPTDWQVPPHTWTAKILTEALQINQSTFEEIAGYVKSWYSTNNPDFILNTKDLQNAAKAWAESHLRPRYQHIWKVVPSNTPWHSEAPYGFMRFLAERERTKVRRSGPELEEVQTSPFGSTKLAPKMISGTSSSLMHTKPSTESLFGLQATPTPKTVFLTFLRRETVGANVRAEYISIDELAIDAPDLAFSNTSALIRYITLTGLRAILAQRGIDENYQLFSFISPRLNSPIRTDMELREGIRWAFNVNRTQFAVFPG